MNPLLPFDYFYYRLVYFYENSFRLIILKEVEGLTGLSIFQFFNIISLFQLIGPINNLKYYYIVVSIFIFLFNLVRYNWFKTYNNLVVLWEYEPVKTRKIKKYIIVSYCILSIALFILSIIKTQKSII